MLKTFPSMIFHRLQYRIFCFECVSKMFISHSRKVYFWKFSKWGLAWDILQLQPLTVFPILDKFPMSIVQNPPLSSWQCQVSVRKLARSKIKPDLKSGPGFFALKLFSGCKTICINSSILSFPISQKQSFCALIVWFVFWVCGPLFGQIQ